MKLTLDRIDLRQEHEGIRCSLTKLEHFVDKAQRAIELVGKATFFEYDRSTYNMIYPEARPKL